MEREAEKQCKDLQLRIDKINEWAKDNVKHPDFMKKVSERNDLSVQLEVKKQQRDGRWMPDVERPEIIIYKQPIK